MRFAFSVPERHVVVLVGAHEFEGEMAGDRILALFCKGIVPVSEGIAQQTGSLILESACRKRISLPFDLLNPALSWLALPRRALTMTGSNGRHRSRVSSVEPPSAMIVSRLTPFWEFRSASRAGRQSCSFRAGMITERVRFIGLCLLVCQQQSAVSRQDHNETDLQAITWSHASVFTPMGETCVDRRFLHLDWPN